MTEAKKTTAADVQATIEKAIADYKAAIDPADTASILGWTNGLYVAFSDDPTLPFERRARACNVIQAEIVATPGMPEEAYAYIPNVTNGAGEVAQLITRQAAIAHEITQAEKLLAHFTEA